MASPKKKKKPGRPREAPPPDAFDKALGARIRELRQFHELSPAEFGKLIGASVSQVFRYESGDTSLRAPQIAKIATVFDSSTAILMGDITISKSR